MDRAAQGLLVVGAGALVALASDGPRRQRESFFTTPRIDYAMLPIAQRAAIAAKRGWLEGADDNTKPRPAATAGDLDRIADYWEGKLRAADAKAEAGGLPLIDDTTGGRVSAHRWRLARVKRQISGLPELALTALPFSSFGVPLPPAVHVAFWRAIGTSAQTVHAVASWRGSVDGVEMWRAMGDEFKDLTGDVAGFLVDVAAGSAEVAGEVAVAFGGGLLGGLLEHPVFLAAAGVGLTLWLRKGP